VIICPGVFVVNASLFVEALYDIVAGRGAGVADGNNTVFT
jgi:hypothetical protein